MISSILVIGHTLHVAERRYRCAIGKSGFSGDKREGDGCTPLGSFVLRECWYRPDRIGTPQTRLPLHIIHETDGWCDDPRSAEYNRHILIPPPVGASYEHLWRDDGVYDLIVPLGYNDDPVVPGKGSAIFMHVAKPDYAGTEGCVALALNDLLEILRETGPETVMEIRPQA